MLFLLLSFLFVVSLFLESPPIELGRKPPVALLQTPPSEAAATEPGRKPDFRDFGFKHLFVRIFNNYQLYSELLLEMMLHLRSFSSQDHFAC